VLLALALFRPDPGGSFPSPSFLAADQQPALVFETET